MTTPVFEPTFVDGEISPNLYARTDLQRYRMSAATARNMFVTYQGGLYSRPGTAFVDYSKQTGRIYPPRLIPFQFSNSQGLALEFGNYYMRVIYDGALVTESGLSVIGATQASPCVITAQATGAQTVTANVGAVSSSYAPGEVVTLAGGVYTYPAQVTVNTTKLVSLALGNPGVGGYAPADVLTLAGGVQTTSPTVTVSATKVISASVAAAGTGGSPGSLVVVTGTTGTGTKFQAQVTIGAAGGISSTAGIIITNPGAYTVNPTTVTAEPVTGPGLTGATLYLNIGVLSYTLSNAGIFTANPAGNSFTQASSTGAGVGATFILGLFAPASVTLSNPGSYSSFPTNPVAQASTTGTGRGATFTCTTTSAQAWNAGDWIYISSIGGMAELNGRTCVIGASLGGGQYSLYDVFGSPIDSTSYPAFTSSGTAARIYTLSTPWAEQDLRYLKFIQSADIMSLCCVNQDTGTEYPPYELSRISDNNWTLSILSVGSNVSPPANAWCFSTSTPYYNNGVGLGWYQYVVTAVNPVTGEESVASNVANLDYIDISVQAGSNFVNWGPVPNINQYNVYKCLPSTTWATYSSQSVSAPPAGSIFGFAGSSYGTQFLDTNITPDFSKVPPLHQEPFARGIIIGVQPISGGGGYTSATAVINSATGSGAVIAPVVLSNQVVAYIVQNPGKNYSNGDTITISGNGSGATAQVNVGPQSGTYPSVPAYFQSRRVYANSLNNPDTYWMSQPGLFTNFDERIPSSATDAIQGSPWSQQVNGIQFMVSMPGGLVVLTGLSAWQLTGAGGSSLYPQPITPASQQAQPQAYNGCSSTIPPIKINYDIIYVQAKGSIYRDLAYQFFTNIYTGVDLTQNSQHLFLGYTIKDHTWCEEPFKVLWSVRSDGVLLSLTYIKDQQVSGWTRHDTYGAFQSVCSVTEPPVDALYLAIQRTINGNTSYMIERMDDRLWRSNVENCWCVDSGLSTPQPMPAAALYINSPAGSVTGFQALVGGEGYSPATYAYVVDNNGLGSGSGAIPTLTIAGGAITNVTFSAGQQGAGYVAPALVIVDPQNTGVGGSAVLALNDNVTFYATAAVFAPSDVGSVIRASGGVATITQYVSATQVVGQLTAPFSQFVPNSGGQVQFQAQGAWTKTAPFTKVQGLYHLVGQSVTGLMDGNPIPPTMVAADGSLTLPSPATAVTVGLGFQAQFQSVNLDAGEPTMQGQRKKVAAATARIEASRGLKMGSNQPNGSALCPPQLAPTWTNLDIVPDKGVTPFLSGTQPLYTGDVRVPVQGGYNTPGQICLQQDNPLPMQILGLAVEMLTGDRPEQQATPRQQQARR